MPLGGTWGQGGARLSPDTQLGLAKRHLRFPVPCPTGGGWGVGPAAGRPGAWRFLQGFLGGGIVVLSGQWASPSTGRQFTPEGCLAILCSRVSAINIGRAHSPPLVILLCLCPGL